MINGNPHEFLEHIYSGQDTPYKFEGEKYWFQGFTVEKGFHMEIFRCSPPYDYLWKYTGSSPLECMEEFQSAPIFDGKSFWDVEKEIEWVDC